jgi:NAD(P)-dependent dehydrogenase (short-subunit alcohol dehydrogenase family)
VKLKDKIAIVTGGARGIGAAFSEALAAAGAKVVIADVLDGSAVVDRLRKTEADAFYTKADVTSQGSVAALVEDTVRRFGTVDILINNAAIFANLKLKSFLEIDSAEWDAVMAVNVRGSFECAKAVAPVMIRNRKGKIINLASGTVFKGSPGFVHYVSSKGAVVAMTRCLARELGAHNICVNAIAPGLTMSEGMVANATLMDGEEANRLTRALQREEVPADLVGTLLFLASDDSAFITGQTIVVDGGSMMR